MVIGQLDWEKMVLITALNQIKRFAAMLSVGRIQFFPLSSYVLCCKYYLKCSEQYYIMLLRYFVISPAPSNWLMSS